MTLVGNIFICSPQSRGTAIMRIKLNNNQAGSWVLSQVLNLRMWWNWWKLCGAGCELAKRHNEAHLRGRFIKTNIGKPLIPLLEMYGGWECKLFWENGLVFSPLPCFTRDKTFARGPPLQASKICPHPKHWLRRFYTTRLVKFAPLLSSYFDRQLGRETWNVVAIYKYYY